MIIEAFHRTKNGHVSKRNPLSYRGCVQGFEAKLKRVYLMPSADRQQVLMALASGQREFQHKSLYFHVLEQ